MIVYFAPGTCARVTMTALEEAEIDYESRVVSFVAGEHRSEEFLKLNPSGKVPALISETKTIVENVAIAIYLDQLFPQANLLPTWSNPTEYAEILADLSFCSSVLHPIVTRLRLPHYFCDVKDARDNVWDLAAVSMHFHFERIEARLASCGPWWYGSNWSTMDTYINWVWFRVVGSGFPVENYPHFATHDKRMSGRSALQRVLAREAIGEAELEKRGLTFSFDLGRVEGDPKLK